MTNQFDDNTVWHVNSFLMAIRKHGLLVEKDVFDFLNRFPSEIAADFIVKLNQNPVLSKHITLKDIISLYKEASK